jgi:hypothetical protein
MGEIETRQEMNGRGGGRMYSEDGCIYCASGVDGCVVGMALICIFFLCAHSFALGMSCSS